MPELQKQVKSFESAGRVRRAGGPGRQFHAHHPEAIRAERRGSCKIPRARRTQTNDVFFVEQVQNINVLATEEQLVDFLYKLGSGSSMIRVRDLTLQPDPPHQRLAADIRLVASYQKNPTRRPPRKPQPQRQNENNSSRLDVGPDRPGTLGANAPPGAGHPAAARRAMATPTACRSRCRVIRTAGAAPRERQAAAGHAAASPAGPACQRRRGAPGGAPGRRCCGQRL